MKKNYFLLLLFVVATLQNVMAKDIYLSATGNDSNDGLSESTAVKTMLRVNEIIAAGDVINVSGMIKITEEPDFAAKTNEYTEAPVENGLQVYHRGYYFRAYENWENVTIQGTDNAKDGFSGENVSPLFQIADIPGMTFKNLQIAKATTRKAPGAEYDSSSSALWARGSTLIFENCLFESNRMATDGAGNGISGDRGSLQVEGGSVTFKNCEFIGNEAKEGGALFLMGGDITIDKCYFGYNECDLLNDSNGGAIYTWVHGAAGELNLTITNTVFEGNTAKKGGAISFSDKVTYQTTGTNTIIDRCAFIANRATQSQGGAIILDNYGGSDTKDKITITNSVFFANSSLTDGGTICIWNVRPQSEFHLVNSTLYGNYTDGNAGHGAGLIFMEGYEGFPQTNLTKKIYNCIFDGNFANESGLEYNDVCFRIAPIAGEMDMQNCYVGASIGVEGSLGVATNNLIDYYPLNEYDETIAGLDDADYYAGNYYAIPLYEEADTRTFGNADFLSQYKITVDISGKPRITANGKCAIGASETTAAELDNGDYPKEEDENSIREQKDNQLKVYLMDDILICMTDTQEQITGIEVYSLTGTKVANGKSTVRVNNFSAGVYLVKITVGQAIVSQKIAIK